MCSVREKGDLGTHLGRDTAPLQAEGVKYTKAEIKGGRREREGPTKEPSPQLRRRRERDKAWVWHPLFLFRGGCNRTPKTVLPASSSCALLASQPPPVWPVSLHLPSQSSPACTAGSPSAHLQEPGVRFLLSYQHRALKLCPL